MDALKSSDLGFPNRCSFKYMLATSSCLYAGFGGELQLAVSNCSTYMLYLGEQELLKADAGSPPAAYWDPRGLDFRSFPRHVQRNF